MKLLYLSFLILITQSTAHKANFSCVFDDIDTGSILSLHRCTADLPNITEINTIVTLTPSNDTEYKRNVNVDAFESSNQPQVEFFPKGLNDIFPNLLLIKIADTNLMEIHQSDLKPFEKLKVLQIYGNLIEYLEKNLFEFNLELTEINLQSTQISYIHPRVFDHLSSLRKLNLYDVLCVNGNAENQPNVLTLIDRVKTSCSNNVTERFLDAFEDENGKLKGKLKKLTKLADEQKILSLIIIALLAVSLMILSILFVIKIFCRKPQKSRENAPSLDCTQNPTYEENAKDNLYDEIPFDKVNVL